MQTIKAKVIICERTLIRSGHKKVYDISLHFLDNVMLEIDKKFYSRKEAIESMKIVVNLINAFNLKVKWSELNENYKECQEKKTQSKNKDEKNRETKSAKGKKSNRSSIIPF